MALENLVTQIQALSSCSDDISQLHPLLMVADEPLHGKPDLLSSFLAQLDPASHSLGYLYILEAFTSGPVSKDQASPLVSTLAGFIDACAADQIRLAPDKFIIVCKRLKDYILLLEAPLRGVYPMLTALRKLQATTEQLTPLHPEFLLLCLSSKSYKIGLSILDDDIFEIDHPRDLFLYCYYGGMICIGQKRYGKALELLRNVITAPMNTINAIAVEAYKKYTLVMLIHHGQFSTNLPKYTSSVAQRNLKNLCQPYVELANTYGNGKITNLADFVLANRKKFENDNNLGLAKQVVSSMYKRSIQRLTLTYFTLSLQDIADAVQLSTAKEAEMHILQMKDGMVSFLEDPEQYKTAKMIEHIDSSIERMMTLSKKLASMDELLSCDPVYIGKVGKERHRFDFDDFDTVPKKFNI